MRTVSIFRPPLISLLTVPRIGTRTVALAATLFWGLVILFVAHARYNDDFRALICVREDAEIPAAFQSVPRAGRSGYDGQWYAALATDPLLRRPETPTALDAPSYRATRILVSLLAWVLALGNPAVALVTYQLLCWGLGIGAVVLIARWLENEGRSPWWSLLLISTAGLAAAVLRSMPDAGALFFLLAALAAHSRGRRWWALALACAAVLARETSYLAALAIAFDELRHRHIWRAATLALLPLAVVAGWQLYLRSVLGVAFESGLGNFSIPFAWVPQKVGTLVSGGHVWWAEVFGLLAIAATTVAVAVVGARPSAWRAPQLAFLAFGGMGLFLSFTVYCETWAYARALIAVPFLTVLVAESRPGGWRRWVLRSVAVFYLLAGLTMVRGELRDATTGRGWLAALGGTAPPPPARTLYVLPVANAGGRAGAEWRTRLELTNLAHSRNTVLLELIPADSGVGAKPRTTITLDRAERRVWTNAVYDLFGFSGAGALRLVPRTGAITAGSLTANIAAATQTGLLAPALTGDTAIHTYTVSRLSGLAHDPAPEADVRTNIGFLNPGVTPVSVGVELFDRANRPLGRLTELLPSNGFIQVDDVFAKVGSPRLEGGWARVHTSTPRGAFFVYASVIRGRDAGTEIRPFVVRSGGREARPRPRPGP